MTPATERREWYVRMAGKMPADNGSAVGAIFALSKSFRELLAGNCMDERTYVIGCNSNSLRSVIREYAYSH